MNPFSSSDISIPSSGSRILSESYTDTGPGGADLSLSELSISPLDTDRAASGDERQEEDALNGKLSAKTREEKLQNDLFVLKKINTSLGVYYEALCSTQSANDRVTAQLEQTDALLNNYISILSKSERFSKLIFDERWEGAQKDEEIVEREQKEARRKARQEAEERALALKREQEREEQEKIARAEREQTENARCDKPGDRSSGVRGVRGTRASMRGLRGSRGAGGSARGHVVSSSSSRGAAGRS